MDSLAQMLKELVAGKQRKIDEDNQIEVSENVEEVQVAGLKQEEEREIHL